MSRLRYNQTFKTGIPVILFCILLFGLILALGILSTAQYRELVAGMETTEATVVDIHLDVRVKASEQEITITYEVDGAPYTRELGTDTKISFSPGIRSGYSIGDRIQIFYDPADPSIIATPRSIRVGTYYIVIAVVGLALVFFALFCALKNRKSFLITQEEYEEEKNSLKNEKLAERMRRKKRRAEWNQMHPKARCLRELALILLFLLIWAVIRFFSFGLLLIALGY